MREQDTVARLGADEFCVLAPETDRDDAARLAARLRPAIAGTTGGFEDLSGSIGCAVFPDDAADPAALMSAADTAQAEDKYATARPGPARTGRRRSLSRARNVPARAVRLLASAALTLGALGVVSACARDGAERPLPAACSAGRDRVIEALRAAPRPVRIDGTPLSACFARRSNGGDLQAVGASFVEAASTLSDKAALRPEGPAARRLGYLVGAAERGAGGAGAPGTNTEIVRRLELELDDVDPGSQALAEGLRAGRTTG